jgi:DNA-binding response OmpR family regulator
MQKHSARLPDLVLLDIRMPGMDGFQVCEKLKSDPSTQDIPIIFISALDAVEDKVRAFTVGGVDYITKPFQAQEVVARVEKSSQFA